MKIGELKGRDFLKLLDFTNEEVQGLVDLAAELKAQKKAGIPHEACKGKHIALIFEKTSTRTRCSFEVAAADLGMHSTYLDPTGSQIGKKESIADTARVLSGIYDGIEYRGYGQSIVEELAEYASVPVWNGLTNEFHPTQILADMLTIQEQFRHGEREEAGVLRRCPLQHGKFPDGRLCQVRHELHRLCAGGLLPGSGADRHLSGHRRGNRHRAVL